MERHVHSFLNNLILKIFASEKSKNPVLLLRDFFVLRMQITVDDFWLLLLTESPFSTMEEMEADLNKHVAEIDSSLPDLQKQLTALLA
jgi:hypothetical protein